MLRSNKMSMVVLWKKYTFFKSMLHSPISRNFLPAMKIEVNHPQKKRNTENADQISWGNKNIFYSCLNCNIDLHGIMANYIRKCKVTKKICIVHVVLESYKKVFLCCLHKY